MADKRRDIVNQQDRQSYDLIADIHGHAIELKALLEKLGYRVERGCYRHPTRKVIFLGDFIDRGDHIRETLEIAKSMVEAGEALAVMGNHEYNAICYHTPDGNGGFLRIHDPKNTRQHAKTLEAFSNSPELLSMYLDWFKTLPLFLDLGDIRVVHACWGQQEIETLGGRDRLNEDLLLKSAKKGSSEYHAVEVLLKGRELRLPEGQIFQDKDVHLRSEIRIRWWLNGRGKTYHQMVFPECENVSDSHIPDAHTERLTGYPVDSPPVFIGHYWLHGATPSRTTINIACLDYSVAKKGPLVAYRWDGEQQLDDRKFVVSLVGS
jgi:hypothetical protein